MFVDYEKLKTDIIGKSIPKPLSGTLSGHAAGEPFDKFVNQLIKNQYPEDTYRQYEYLNSLFSKIKMQKQSKPGTIFLNLLQYFSFWTEENLL